MYKVRDNRLGDSFEFDDIIKLGNTTNVFYQSVLFQESVFENSKILQKINSLYYILF